jgi:hypothetical protein
VTLHEFFVKASTPIPLADADNRYLVRVLAWSRWMRRHGCNCDDLTVPHYQTGEGWIYVRADGTEVGPFESEWAMYKYVEDRDINEEKRMTEIEATYGQLIRRFAQAYREKDKPLQDEIDSAMKLFEKLWPEDIKRWNDRYGDKKQENA